MPSFNQARLAKGLVLRANSIAGTAVLSVIVERDTSLIASLHACRATHTHTSLAELIPCAGQTTAATVRAVALEVDADALWDLVDNVVAFGLSRRAEAEVVRVCAQ